VDHGPCTRFNVKWKGGSSRLIGLIVLIAPHGIPYTIPYSMPTVYPQFFFLLHLLVNISYMQTPRRPSPTPCHSTQCPSPLPGKPLPLLWILMSTIRAFMMSPSLSWALADFYLPVSLAIRQGETETTRISTERGSWISRQGPPKKRNPNTIVFRVNLIDTAFSILRFKRF